VQQCTSWNTGGRGRGGRLRSGQLQQGDALVAEQLADLADAKAEVERQRNEIEGKLA